MVSRKAPRRLKFVTLLTPIAHSGSFRSFTCLDPDRNIVEVIEPAVIVRE
jgi:hypothetical protein